MTPYADVDATLLDLLGRVQAILGRRFFGMYLYGSLAAGEFHPERSDIDFLVVTDDELPDDLVAELAGMHEALFASESRWAKKLEGSYLPLAAVRVFRHDDPPRLRPYIDPVSPDDLRTAVREILTEWWAPMIDDPKRIEQPGYQPFAVLSMCRALYTLEHGTIVSKPRAGRWAATALDHRWSRLIEDALQWREGEPAGSIDETVELIRYTVGVALS